MYLNEQFLRLPLDFDAAVLADEVAALPTRAWVPHPNKLPGNGAVRLVTPDGTATEGVAGNMAPTEFLLACPYMMEVMAEIGAVWGRCRLMSLAPGAVVPAHIDTNYYWRKHLRIHVPITTTPEVLFTSGPETVHMAAGQCWMFDTFSVHHVRNGSDRIRVHLVIDTVGGEQLWDLMEESRAIRNSGATLHARQIAPGERSTRSLRFETASAKAVMSPWELQCHVQFIADRALADPRLGRVMTRLQRFVESWHGAWAEYGPNAHEDKYRRLLSALEDDLRYLSNEPLVMRNRLPLHRQMAELFFEIASSLEHAKARVADYATT